MNGDLSSFTSMHFSMLIRHPKILPNISQQLFIDKKIENSKRQVLEDTIYNSDKDLFMNFRDDKFTLA